MQNGDETCSLPFPFILNQCRLNAPCLASMISCKRDLINAQLCFPIENVKQKFVSYLELSRVVTASVTKSTPTHNTTKINCVLNEVLIFFPLNAFVNFQ